MANTRPNPDDPDSPFVTEEFFKNARPFRERFPNADFSKIIAVKVAAIMIEFHDSHLVAIDSVRNVLTLNAYVHRLEPDAQHGVGGMQLVELAIGELKASGDTHELPFDIFHADLHLKGKEWKGLLEAPSRFGSTVELTLTNRDGLTAKFVGLGFRVDAVGDFEYVEASSYFDDI